MSWVLTHWLMNPGLIQDEPSKWRMTWLQSHSVVGLFFFSLFGYLLHAHIRPAWTRRKKRLSGGVLTCLILILLVSVPGLFYVTSELLKPWIIGLHTYLGLALIFFFAIHYVSKSE